MIRRHAIRKPATTATCHSVPNEAQLCLNVTAPKLDRLSCAIFLVLENWKLGEPLTRRGYLVVDDRGHYPNESGKTYWYAAPETLPQHPAGY